MPLMPIMTSILTHAVCFWLLLLVGGSFRQDLEIYPSARVWSTNYFGLLYSIKFCSVGDIFVVLGSFQLSATADGQRVIQTNNSYINGVHHPYNKTCAIVRIYAIQGLVISTEWIMYYGGPERLFNQTFRTQNCKNKISAHDPKIYATGFTYNEHGQFVCPAGQELFYSNSTPGITNTICQNDATWYGSSGLECWSVPDSLLEGNFTGQTGSIISITCSWNQKLYPAAEYFKMAINGNEIQIYSPKMSLKLSIDMNGKTVQCQVITKYTKVKLNKGWSQKQTLNVTYRPYTARNISCQANKPCIILVSSNPLPNNPVLFTKGNISKALNWASLSPPDYTLHITESAGNYTLQISNVIGTSSVRILVMETPNQNTTEGQHTSSSLTMIIGISVAGIVVPLLASTMCVAFLCSRKQKGHKIDKTVVTQTSKNPTVYVNTPLYENTRTNTATATYQNTAEYQNPTGCENKIQDENQSVEGAVDTS